MSGQENKRPDQIRRQKQRVAVAARWQPTRNWFWRTSDANLDHDTAYRIIELMRRCATSLDDVCVLHARPEIMSEAEVIFTLEDGKIDQHRIRKKRWRPMLNILKIAIRNLARFTGARC